MIKKYSLVLIAFLCFVVSGFGQVTIFSETIGICCGTTNTSIAATAFDNSTLLFTGNADTRTSTASTGYTGASAGRNVFITNTIDRFLEISGINTTSYTNLTLSFGHYKSTTTGNNELAIEVSSDGTTYSPLIYSRATGSGTASWNLITPIGTIPSTANLRIRFRQTSTTTQFRMDDIRLVGELSAAGCNITSAGLTATTCDDNGTDTNPSDDFITFDLNPTGSDVGSNYSVSVSGGATITPSTGTYGSATSFTLQDGSAGSGEDVTVTITDGTDATCMLDVTVSDPGSCSAGGIGVCGEESFDNSNATSSYAANSYIGDNGVTWTFTESRDESTFGITGNGLMLRDTNSTLTSSNVSGGIGSFTCSLRKAFTGTGDRQVELFVNGISQGASIAWDNTTVQTFTVNGINISGNVAVEIRNITNRQVIVDDIEWNCYSACTAPANPTGAITGTSPACNSTALTYTGTAIAPIVNYWQTTAAGASMANNASSTFNATTTGTYYVRAYNSATSCWSSGTVSQSVTINTPPSIDTQPTDETINEGDNVTFTVASSDATSYSWEEFDGVSWSTVGSGVSFTMTSVSVSKNGYQYRVILSNGSGCGTTVSNSATLTVLTAACVEQGFNGGTTAPFGWSFTGITGSYTTAGNFGNTSPSIRFDTTNDVVLTSTVTNATELSFWVKGLGTNAVSALLVEGFNGSGWVEVDNITNSIPTTGTVYTYNASSIPALPSNIQQFRFTYTKEDGNLAFDDVTIYCGTPITGREINVTGNNNPIIDGSTSPSSGNNTNFGSTLVNTTIVKTFRIQNLGTEDLTLTLPITLSDVSAPQEFTITQPSVSVIPAGSSTTFTVSFNSAVAGLFTNTVSINNNDSDENPYNWDIIATATSPPPPGTIYNPGELIFVGYDGQINGSGSNDEYLVATLVDMVQGTTFSIVNSRYEAGAAANNRTNKWGSGSDDAADQPFEAKLTYNGTTAIPAGSILRFVTNNSPIWYGTVEKIVGTTITTITSSFTGSLPSSAGSPNVSTSGSDQMYLIQGEFVFDGTNTPNQANYFLNGVLLHGFTNRSAWVPLTDACNGDSSGGNSRESRLPSALTCFNVENTSTSAVSAFYENDKEHGIATIRQIILAVSDVSNNWTLGTGRYTLNPSNNTASAAGKTFLLGVSNPPGHWVGNVSTNWFNCANWEGLKVPESTTNVSVLTSGINDVVVNHAASYSDDYGDLAICNNLTINGKKVTVSGNILNKLEVNGDLVIENVSNSILDMDDTNAGTLDGELYLHGNWINKGGNDAFKEGNSTVIFAGTGTQSILLPPPLPPTSTEEFYNVVLDNDWDVSASNDLYMNGNLTINSGKTVIVPADRYIHVDNNLTNNGTFNILNNGSLVQVKDTGVNTGKISMVRKASIKNQDYVYWSSPITGFNVSNITATNFIYKWDPTEENGNLTQGNWLPAANEIMEIGKGYIVRAPNGQTAPAGPSDLNFTATFYSADAGLGVPNNGEIAVTIDRGSNAISDNDIDDNWNLVGNPYPSAISAVAFLTQNTSIDGYVNLWKHGLAMNSTVDPFYQNFALSYHQSDYFYYNSTGDSDGPTSFTGYIAAGQSFMVSMVDGALPSSGSIVFKNNMRDKGYANNQFFRLSQNTGSTEEKHRIWLDLIAPETPTNRILVGYVDGATMDKDRMFDAQISFDAISAGIYTLINEDSYIIQGRSLPFSDADVIPLGLKLTQAGNYVIAIGAVDGLFESGNQIIYLKDNVLGLIHNLNSQPYSFNSESGVFNNRFEIVFTEQALSVIENEIPASGLTIYELPSGHVKFSVGNGLSIQAVTIIDMLGRTLYQLEGDSASEVYDLSNLSQAAYVAKVTLSNGQTITKRAVKRQ